MHLNSTRFVALFLTAFRTSVALSPSRLVYEFPLGTWVENLAVRSYGPILVTSVTAPTLYQIDPSAPNPQATLVHNFTSALWTAGITETTPDTFYVAAANGSTTILPPTPGSNRLFRVKFSGPNAAPEVDLTATVKDASFLNGLTTLNTKTVLAADSAKGAVWAVDVLNGTSKIVIQDPLMAPSAASPIGINGINVQGNQLYFTNSAQNVFAKIAIMPDGSPVGPPATVIASAAAGTGFDDFALDWRGNAFLVTAGGNTVVEVKKKGKQVVVAGNLDSTDIAEPTGAKFGRTWKDIGTLYVTTAGGLRIPVSGDQVVGGQLVAVDFRGG